MLLLIFQAATFAYIHFVVFKEFSRTCWPLIWGKLWNSEILDCRLDHALGCSMTGSKNNPPIEAEQTNLSGFLRSFYWSDYVSSLSTLW